MSRAAGVRAGHGTRPRAAGVAAAVVGVIGVIVACVAGCGPRIATVTGVVSVNGRPQEGLKLVFEPREPQGRRAMGTTGADGRYTLGRQGLGNNQGAVTGRYTVRVYANPDSEDAPKIPPRYNTETTLAFEVQPGRANSFDVDIVTP